MFRFKIMFDPSPLGPPGGLLRSRNSGYINSAPVSIADLLGVSRARRFSGLRDFCLRFATSTSTIDEFFDVWTSIPVRTLFRPDFLPIRTLPLSDSFPDSVRGAESPSHLLIRRGTSFGCRYAALSTVVAVVVWADKTSFQPIKVWAFSFGLIGKFWVIFFGLWGVFVKLRS